MGDSFRDEHEARVRLVGLLDDREKTLLLGVLIARHPAIFDEIAASIPESWHPEPPGTVEDVVAASIEHQGQYRNELRHLPQ